MNTKIDTNQFLKACIKAEGLGDNFLTYAKHDAIMLQNLSTFISPLGEACMELKELIESQKILLGLSVLCFKRYLVKLLLFSLLKLKLIKVKKDEGRKYIN